MATATETSPAGETIPRAPNSKEIRQLADWLQNQGNEPDEAFGIAKCAYVAVFDHYMTGSPGYCGKLMSVVWDGSPSFFDAFTWEKGKMVRESRDYDDKECDRCGGKNGTLCFNCWRSL